MLTSPPIIRLSDVIHIYREADVETIALRGIDLDVAEGEFLAIVGRSGSGKSTLLQLMAGSDRPTAGRIVVDGVDLSRADEQERAAIRGARLGVVFQSQNLVPFLNLEENVLLAMKLAGRPAQNASARTALDLVGLAERRAHRPSQLSGGEQQRASLAVVLATRPRIILADEITGEVDSANGQILIDLVVDAHATGGVTVVIATHDPELARRADRTVILRDGRVADDIPAA